MNFLSKNQGNYNYQYVTDINKSMKTIYKQVDEFNSLVSKYNILTKESSQNSLSNDVGELFSSFFTFFDKQTKSSPFSAVEIDRIDPSKFQEFIELRDKLLSLYQSVLKLNSEIEECSGSHKHSKCLELLEKIEEFQKVILQFNTLRIQLLNPLKSNLDGVKDESFRELKDDIDAAIKGNEENISQLKKEISCIKEKLELEFKELNEIKLHYSDIFIQNWDSLNEEHLNCNKRLNQFLDCNFSELDKNELKELQSKASAILIEYSEKIDAFDSINVVDIVDIEQVGKKLVLELEYLHLHYEKTWFEIAGLKYKIYRNCVHNKRDMQSLSSKELLLEIDVRGDRLKKVSYSTEKLKSNSTIDFETPFLFQQMIAIKDYILERFPIGKMDVYSSIEWILLNDKNGNHFADELGIGFQNTIQNLQVKQNQISENLNQLIDSSPEKKDLEEQLHFVNRVFYHTYLVRIIDIVGEKQSALKKNILSEQEIEILHNEIELLDKHYSIMFEQYKAIPKASHSIMSAALNSAFEFIRSLATFGMAKSALFSIEELARKKHFADLGFNVMDEIGVWLSELQVNEGQTIIDVLKKQVDDFLNWADQDPKTAMTLASDMVLTCGIIGDQSYVDQFKSQMRVKAYGTAFNDGWKPFAAEEKLPTTPQSLKFYALSQLFRSAPVLVSVLKSAATNDYSNPIGALIKTGFEALKTHAVQQVGDFIPEEHAQLGLQLLNILQGRDFQYLLEEQRNIELAKIGGNVAQLLADPSKYLSRVAYETKIWWKTVRRSNGMEKISRISIQILLPAGTIVGAAALTTLSILGWPISLLTIGTISFTTISASLSAARKSDRVFNRVYSTRQEVIDLIKEEKEQAFLLRIRDKIRKQTIKFLKSLEESHSLSQIQAIPALNLSNEERVLFNNQKEEILESIIKDQSRKIQLNLSPSATDYVQCYQQALRSIQDEVSILKSENHLFKERASEEIRKMKEVMAIEMGLFLRNEWLIPNIDQCFAKFALSDNENSLKDKIKCPKDYVNNELKKIAPMDTDVQKDLKALLKKNN